MLTLKYKDQITSQYLLKIKKIAKALGYTLFERPSEAEIKKVLISKEFVTLVKVQMYQ